MNDLLKNQISDLDELLDYITKKKEKLSNPVNERTGNPLSPKTIKNYERDLKFVEHVSRDISDSINAKLENSTSVSIDTLLEMCRFTLNSRGNTGETFPKFVLSAFGATLVQENLI